MTLTATMSGPGAASTAPVLPNPSEGIEMAQGTCSVECCSRAEYALNLCSRHYRRNRIHGDPTGGTPDRIYGDPVARFWSKVNKDGPLPTWAPFLGPCWLWTRPLTDRGYAKIGWSGRNVFAHRVAYEMMVGPLPDGMTVDHLCRVRHCVNPAHLEAVTQSENSRRARFADRRSAA